MPSSFNNFTASPVGMFLVLFLSVLVLGFIVRAGARWALLPAARRFFIEQQQQQQLQRQQELDRQARLRFYLDDARRRAIAAAAAAEHVRHLQADRKWLMEMDERGRRHQKVIQAQEPAVATGRVEEYTAYLRRDLEIKLGKLEADEKHLEDAAAFAKYSDDKQQYRPAKGGLLYDPNDEDPDVIRGDKSGDKKEKNKRGKPEGVLSDLREDALHNAEPTTEPVRW